mmetsp:Transcript_27248/g.82296  ORF Transcript_27248/g.82296 Transcript_27248/m.82296 type:complete len:248 (+) Transcript_27248:516-1259(+)
MPSNASTTCGLTARSWLFGGATRSRTPTASRSRPVMPAAGSACPPFALTLPTASASSSCRPVCSEASERASIGSPSAVPVPCSSALTSSPSPSPASSSEPPISDCWAKPFGAVRLALLPSCRTQLPLSVATGSCGPPGCDPAGRSAAAVHASARAYPSARLSSVWLRPSTDVMPATANVSPTRGDSITLTADTSAAELSPSCSDRSAAWPATSADEHAVSYAAHGPCSPSAKDRRPEATECAPPVAA